MALESTYTLNVDSNAGDVGDDVAGKIASLKDQLQGGTAELREMQKALRNMKGVSGVSASTVQDLKDKITVQKQALGQAQASYIEAGGSLSDLGKRTKTTQQSVLGMVPASLKAKLAIGAMAAASTAAVGALVRYGIAQADARRSELLRLEGLTKIRRFMVAGDAVGFREVGGSASFLQGEIDRVSDSVAIGRDKVAGYARELALVGLKGGALQDALEGMAITAATQGESQAQQFKAMALGYSMTGQSVKELSDDVRARLGGIAKRQMLDWNVQTTKLRENFGKLFDGLKIDKMLGGMKEFTDLFSQSTVTGRALKGIMTSLVQPFTDGLGVAGRFAKEFFQGVVIGVLEMRVAFLRTKIWIKQTFEIPKELKGMVDAVDLGTAAVWGLGAAVTALAVGLGIMAVAAFPVTALGIAIAALGSYIVDGIGGIDWDFLADKMTGWFDDTIAAFGDFGGMVLDGLVGGIKKGISKVTDAVRWVGKMARSAFGSELKMQSPSRVFMGAGLNVSLGAARGIDRGRLHVVRASTRLAQASAETYKAQQLPGVAPGAFRLAAPRVAPARSPAARVAAPAAPRARSGPVVQINELHVHAQTGDPEGLAAAVKAAIEQAFEGAATQMGAAA